MRTTRYVALAVLALGLAGTTVAPAFADGRPGEIFHVTGLGPYQFLHLMNGPSEFSGLQVLIPAAGCNLRATGASQGNWIEVNYRGNTGVDYLGWADVSLLSPERGGYDGGYIDYRHRQARQNHGYDAPTYGQQFYPAPAYTPPVYTPQPTQYSWRHQNDHFYGY